MKILINEKCDCDKRCEAIDYFVIESKHLEINFFDDYGTKFIYIRIGKKEWKWCL